MPRNIAYQTPHLARYFQAHRRKWDEFYASERWIFERVAGSGRKFGQVLDVGCAVGGLANAFGERFAIDDYTGVDISEETITIARQGAGALPFPAAFIAADICDCPQLGARKFDLVVGLSVIDWNIDASGMLAACWDRVAPGGSLVLSLRLTPGKAVCDIDKSYQIISDGIAAPEAAGERAQYTVFNTLDAFHMLGRCDPAPSDILAYGYWGKPSSTATTPFDKLVFAVVSVRKAIQAGDAIAPSVELHLPVTAFPEAL